MRRELIYALFILFFFVYFGFNSVCVSEDVSQMTEKVLSLDGIFRTSYALGGDLRDVERPEEAIYLAKGDIKKALATLKDILIEHRRPVWALSRREPINIIVFKGISPTNGKIEITKIVSKGNSFEVYAKYIDFPELDIPSQPAAIIPLGKLSSGKYTVSLYVDGQLRKKVEFKVRRYIFI